MRKLFFFCAAVFTALAYAGSRAAESSGATPTLTTDGVSLRDSEGCRVSARVGDGGTVNGGTLALWYHDSVLGWTRGSTSLDCTLESNKLWDGGAPSAQVCPDRVPAARFGRMAAEARSLIGVDGGVITANVRVECWGRDIP